MGKYQEKEEGSEAMEAVKIEKADHHAVSCLLDVPEKPRGMVIAVHGFSSSKECATYQMLFRRMPAAGYGVLGIDLPGHGFEEARQETLRIEGCLNSIEAAESFAAGRFPGVPVVYFASSFGAYLTGLYVCKREHRGTKAFFRSAAVNMPRLFVKENPGQRDKKMMADLEEKGYFDANIERATPVRITREMYHDLETTDLFQVYAENRPGNFRVMMAHGEKDAVIDPEAARAFAEQFGIPIVFFENEGHSLSDHPDTPDRVADLAIAFYDAD